MNSILGCVVALGEEIRVFLIEKNGVKMAKNNGIVFPDGDIL